ncbi:V-type proton ATPase subunit E [Pestalotiopsis fici W106-1]|uniref:V-type proton ATPase subunit E n=1 Tax=Pestalotiopsis fici (strain W106-1 / CGMCC3.15140) TaxID=1229662 RepID=W3WX75_PESFW|nr:V-type proton ATPase subunit E [Pestalotiopsis fici W106-1]ETS78478.1 V-type proton ATPase subunit E [Pestalotiopsis fici W106-1]
MSQVHAMSDAQVDQELKKMTAFIKQEALEKAREIEIKANEEFSIEKSKLVRQETDAIDASYAKKFKQASMTQQITRSTVANKTRLKVLGARQELLDDIFDAAGKKLVDGSKDESKYRTTLKNLILEGLYALTEKEVSVRGRKKDAKVLKGAIEDAEKEYKEKTGKETKVIVDEENVLPEGSAGGVIIVGGQGKIDINNTFEERLKLLQDVGLPAVRKTLFGDNPNRKFFD